MAKRLMAGVSKLYFIFFCCTRKPNLWRTTSPLKKMGRTQKANSYFRDANQFIMLLFLLWLINIISCCDYIYMYHNIQLGK
jgi:hypothetical protein